jgi:hypothetical protein
MARKVVAMPKLIDKLPDLPSGTEPLAPGQPAKPAATKIPAESITADLGADEKPAKATKPTPKAEAPKDEPTVRQPQEARILIDNTDPANPTIRYL